MITLLILAFVLGAWLSSGAISVRQRLPRIWAQERSRWIGSDVRPDVRRRALLGIACGPVPLMIQLFLYGLDTFIDARDPERAEALVREKELLAQRDLRAVAQQEEIQ